MRRTLILILGFIFCAAAGIIFVRGKMQAPETSQRIHKIDIVDGKNASLQERTSRIQQIYDLVDKY